MNDYEKAFQLKDPKYRSSILTNGLNKSGERALLYATGMDEEDLKKTFCCRDRLFLRNGARSHAHAGTG